MLRRHSTLLRRLWVAVAILALVGIALPTLAQELPARGLIEQARRATPIPPWTHPYPPPNQPIFFAPNQAILELHAVDATIDGPVASVRVKQVFRNDTGQTIEGEYIFPLPKDAAVSDFQLTVDGETLEGRLLPADEARAIYESIVRRRQDPALLQYLGQGLFQANVFPIPPGETRTLEFVYNQILTPVAGLYRFNYPLVTRHLTARPVENIAVSVALVNQPGLRTIYTSNYPSRIERTADSSATVTFESTGEQPQADFDLYFGADTAEVGANLLSYKPAGEDGYFVLLLAPGVEVADDEIVARDIVLVVDVSGSMQGQKIDQARAGAQYVVEHLNPEDRFNLISFSTGASLWQQELQPATVTARKQAATWIDRLDAAGSTDINRALLEALAQFETDEESTARPAYILFLTDGQPTMGETNPALIVDNAQANRPVARTVRLFPFGVGYDVNTDLLAALAQELGGRDSYVEPDQRVDEAISAFYSQISTPVLADVALDFGDEVMTEELYPYPLPDLFAGEQLVVAGRYRGGGEVEITLTGEVNGEQRVYVYDRELSKQGGDPFVARLWATRKVGALLDQVRRDGPQPELIDAITELSLRYGIVTPYTAYLVEEPVEMVAAPGSGAAPLALELNVKAQASVAAAADELARQSASGMAAVRGTILRRELAAVTAVRQEEAVRYVAGRTFRQQGYVTDASGAAIPFWVDTRFEDDMAVTTVEFGSEAYFALLAEPEMAAWLALSPELLIVTGADEAVRVTTGE